MNRSNVGFRDGRGSHGKKLNRDGFGNRKYRNEEGEPEAREVKIRHPPHLKGKEIGLFYARLSQGKGKSQPNRKREDAPLIQLPSFTISKIQSLLRAILSEQHGNAVENWRSINSDPNNSFFKEKFLENLKGNDNTHFAAEHSGSRLNSSLCQDSGLDQTFQEELALKETREEFLTMMDARKKLPTWNRHEEILTAVHQNQVIVICGETGCGKTTQVGQFLLDEAISSGRGSAFHAICTQPRRIAAISVAQRVADERCEPCGGGSVGYQVRLERRLPRKRGSILYCTTGILVQFLQSDPYLENVSHILLDEVHERDIMTDFVLTVARDLLPKRPDLRVILMSATIDSDIFSKYFNGCPVLVIPGMTHPVKSFYLEDVLSETEYRIRPKEPKRFRGRQDAQSMQLDIEYTKMMVPSIEEMEVNRSYPYHVLKSLRMRESEESPEDLVVELLKHICTRECGGAILIFFPGWEQISKLHKKLLADRIFSSRKYLILPLHSLMPTVNQRQVFDRPPPGVRKVILSTNIAETSLTIDDVVFVIDSGKIKQSDYDPTRNLDTLQSDWISLANGRQRQGRAGRTQPGVCYKLYTRCRESLFAPHPVPEMRRMRLEELILRVKILKLGQVEEFLRHVPEPPDERTVQLSLELLRTLGALDAAERLTPLGFHLAQLPTDPRTGKLILVGAIFGCLEPVVSIAAALSFKDPFVMPLHQEDQVRKCKKQLDDGHRSDHLLIAKVMQQYRSARRQGYNAAKNYCQEHYLSGGTMSMLHDMVDQFCRDLHERQFISDPSVSDPAANVNSADHRLVRAVLCAGLFPNIAKVRLRIGQTPTKAPLGIRTAEDGRVEIHPRSVNYSTREFESSWICYHGKVKTSSIFLHDCSEVSPLAIMFFGSNAIHAAVNGEVRIQVGREIEFRCDQTTVDLTQSLRSRWNNYLGYRVSHPGPTDWSQASPDSSLLRAIAEFVTADQVDGRIRHVQNDGYKFPNFRPAPSEQKEEQPVYNRDLDEEKEESEQSSPPDRWDEDSSGSEDASQFSVHLLNLES